MFTQSGIERIRDELLQAVRLTCRGCANPRHPPNALRFDDPMTCPCRCERTEGILRAAENIVKNGPTKPIRKD